MLRVLIVLLLLFTATSCTENERARSFGGTATIALPPGDKLVIATWKEVDLWYLTRPMVEGEQPVTSTFTESSAWGLMNGKVVFVESVP